MGRRNAIVASTFQLLNCTLTTLAYTIGGANSIQQIAQIACSYEGKDPCASECLGDASGGVWKMILVFGGVEVFLSQVRNLEEAWWVSVMGTLGSLGYALIALVLCVANGRWDLICYSF